MLSTLANLINFDKEIQVDEQNIKILSKAGSNRATAEAEFIRGQVPASIGKEAASMWPADVELAVPEGWKEGEKVAAQGPHGRVLFEVPADTKPGATQVFRLRPAPDLLLEVPKGASEGQEIFLERKDGTRITIAVPKGKAPGDTFEVTPPAVMVLVPEEAKAGDVVCFPLPGPPSKQWFSATIPDELVLGAYFAARLPPPDGFVGGETGENAASPKAASETTSTGPTDESPVSDDSEPL